MRTIPSCIAIAAMDRARGLGVKGDLPWHLPGDLKHFAQTTKTTRDPNLQNAVVMGRVTYETIPGKYWPLSGRRNVVLSRDPECRIPDAEVYTSLEDAIERVADAVETVFIVGGGQIYSLALALPSCSELILTLIDADFSCDAFFPAYQSDFHRSEQIGEGQHDGLSYVIERWKRNP